MTALEEIKKALEGVGPLKVEFTPDCDEFNAIIAPINDDYDGTFFTVIGCGDKQDKLGGFMAVAVNTVQELVDTIESLQAKNEGLLKRAATAEKRLREANSAFERERKLHLQNQQLNRTLEARAEAAEAEVKRYREALIAAKTRMRNCRGAIESDQVVDKDVHGSLQNGIRDIQEALASTGGEHHAE